LAGPHPRSAARTSLSLGLERRLSASGCMLAGPTSFTAPGPHPRRFGLGLPLAGTDFSLPQLRALTLGRGVYGRGPHLLHGGGAPPPGPLAPGPRPLGRPVRPVALGRGLRP